MNTHPRITKYASFNSLVVLYKVNIMGITNNVMINNPETTNNLSRTTDNIEELIFILYFFAKMDFNTGSATTFGKNNDTPRLM